MKKTNSHPLFFACLVVASIVLLMSSAMAQADVYQFEVGAMYRQLEDDDNFKFQSYGLAAGYYFSPVSLTTLPWAEAAFLARASNISIMGMKVTTEMPGDTLGTFEGDGYMLDATAEIFLPGLPLYLSAEVSRMMMDMKATGFNTESKNTEITGKIGVLPMQGILVGALYTRSSETREGELTVPFFRTIDDEDTTNTYGGFFKLVQPIGNGMAFGIDLSVSKIKYKSHDNTGAEEDTETSDTNIDGMVTIFPIAQLGLGVTFETQRGDDKANEGNTYGAEVIFFPMPNVGINASFSRFIPKDDKVGVEADSIFLAAMLRI